LYQDILLLLGRSFGKIQYNVKERLGTNGFVYIFCDVAAVHVFVLMPARLWTKYASRKQHFYDVQQFIWPVTW